MNERPTPRLSRPEIQDRYRVVIQRGRLGFWRYRITGHGIGVYEMGGPTGRRRRSRIAALQAAERRVARLWAKDRRYYGEDWEKEDAQRSEVEISGRAALARANDQPVIDVHAMRSAWDEVGGVA